MRVDVKNLYTGRGLFVVPVHFAGYTVAIENSAMKAVKRKYGSREAFLCTIPVAIMRLLHIPKS